MCKPPFRKFVPALAVAGLAALANSHAQTTLYWDATGTSTGLGGTGTWQNGAGNWSGTTTGTTSATWNNANRDNADFRGTAGTVTAAGGVSAGSITFNSGGYTLQGDTITIGRLAGSGAINVVRFQGGTGTNTISNNIVIQDDGTATTADASYVFRNDASALLDLNGNISVNYGVAASGNKVISLQAVAADSVIRLDGSVLAPVVGTTQRLQFNGAGTYYVTADNSTGLTSSTGSQHVKGVVYLGNDKALGNNASQLGISSTGASDTAAFLTDGARTIANNFSLGGANASAQLILGGGSADLSLFTGNINMGSSVQSLRVSAVAGGRVNFSGTITGSGSGQFIKQGDGVVALARAAGSTQSRAVAVNAGTLLLMNTSNSATGTGTVTVAGGSALGGTGSASGAVTASAASSVFTPGDMTAGGVSSIGNLTLSGGLAATNGATFKFDLNGASSDSITFGTGLDLDGTITFDFVNLGTVNAGVAYTLFTGSGAWDATGASFVFNGPAGYLLDSSYGTGGYIFDAANHTLTVQFSVVPEPSVAALAVAGIVGLGLRRRSRR
jgi:fibronectin-binding autotransporter adhesin